MSQEQAFYNPKFFEKLKTNDNKYFYKVKPRVYWEMRESGIWIDIPRIFDDDCKGFYK